MTGSLATVIDGQGGGNASVRMGTVTSFAAGVIVVDLGGASVVQASYLDSYAPAAADVVAMVSAGSAWLVIGSVARVPGQFIPQVAEVLTQESTSSTTYADLTTVGPSVSATVGNSGRVLVLYSVQIGWSIAAAGAMGGAAGLDVSGANTVAVNENQRVRAWIEEGGATTNTGIFQLGGHKFFQSFATGLTTFKIKYKSNVSGRSADFDNRSIVVIPL